MNRNTQTIVRIAGIIALVIVALYILGFFLRFVVSPILAVIGQLIGFAFFYLLPTVIIIALIMILYYWLTRKR